MQNVSHNSSSNALGCNMIANCGIYCGSCGIYLATKENNVMKILEYAVALNQSYEDTLCNGCRSDRRSAHCSKICLFNECSKSSEVNSCGECDKFPCRQLAEFQSKMPHRIEIVNSLAKLKELGTKKWLIDMRSEYSCRSCKTINNAYEVSCRKCGKIPSCDFVSKYMAEIEKYISS